MNVYKNVTSIAKPPEIDMESSKFFVYVNSNIRRVEGDGKLVPYYTYDQEVYTKDEYNNKQFELINHKIDGYVDINSLDLDQTKEYMIEKVGEECTAKIYSGVDVKLLDGNTEHFSLTNTDQLNIQSQLGSIINFGLKKVAYHADGQECRQYNYVDFLNIVLNCNRFIITETTYCNFLNNYIRSLETKEEVLSVYYGMQLSEQKMEEIQFLVFSQLNELISAVKEKFPEIDV